MLEIAIPVIYVLGFALVWVMVRTIMQWFRYRARK